MLLDLGAEPGVRAPGEGHPPAPEIARGLGPRRVRERALPDGAVDGAGDRQRPEVLAAAFVPELPAAARLKRAHQRRLLELRAVADQLDLEARLAELDRSEIAAQQPPGQAVARRHVPRHQPRLDLGAVEQACVQVPTVDPVGRERAAQVHRSRRVHFGDILGRARVEAVARCVRRAAPLEVAVERGEAVHRPVEPGDRPHLRIARAARPRLDQHLDAGLGDREIRLHAAEQLHARLADLHARLHPDERLRSALRDEEVGHAERSITSKEALRPAGVNGTPVAGSTSIASS
jgi:hypothetical protein